MQRPAVRVLAALCSWLTIQKGHLLPRPFRLKLSAEADLNLAVVLAGIHHETVLVELPSSSAAKEAMSAAKKALGKTGIWIHLCKLAVRKRWNSQTTTSEKDLPEFFESFANV